MARYRNSPGSANRDRSRIDCHLPRRCNSAPPAITRADYTAHLNNYYEGRPMCLWPETVKFPAEDVTPDEATERGFAALVDAGLLIRKPAGKHAPKGSSTFDLTPEGRSAPRP